MVLFFIKFYTCSFVSAFNCIEYIQESGLSHYALPSVHAARNPHDTRYIDTQYLIFCSVPCFTLTFQRIAERTVSFTIHIQSSQKSHCAESHLNAKSIIPYVWLCDAKARNVKFRHTLAMQYILDEIYRRHNLGIPSAVLIHNFLKSSKMELYIRRLNLLHGDLVHRK